MSPGLHLDVAFVVAHAVHQAHHGAAAIEPANLAIAAQHQRRQMAGIRVGKLRRVRVVVGQEQRGVLLRLRCCDTGAGSACERMRPGDSNSLPPSPARLFAADVKPCQ